MTPDGSTVRIREASGGDAPAIARLYASLVASPHVNVRPGRVEAIAADPHNFLLVAEVHGTVCGTAILTVCLDAMFGNQPYGVIENVVVEEGRRGKGIGRRLLEHVERICLTSDCSKIMLLSTASRGQAHRFFERHGFSSSNKRGFVKYRNQFGTQGGDPTDGEPSR